DLGRVHLAKSGADALDELCLQDLSVRDVVAVAAFGIKGDRRRTVSVNSSQEQLRRPELALAEDRLAHDTRRAPVVTQNVRGDENESMAVLLKGCDAGGDRVVHSLRKGLATFVAGHRDRLSWGDIDFRYADLEIIGDGPSGDETSGGERQNH